MELSAKGKELIKMYSSMARDGYTRNDQTQILDAFSDFEARAYREPLEAIFKAHNVKTILDYGCGGSKWDLPGFDEQTNQSAKEFFNLTEAHLYEPAREIDQRNPADCVISFDVLEHIFITDIPIILHDMFRYSRKILVLNIACYPAAAQLPNGENAHITVRHPLWWKGMLDSISINYPDITVFLLCSQAWRETELLPEWKSGDWQSNAGFVVDL